MKRCIKLAMYIELLCMYIVEGKLTRVKLFGSESIDGKVSGVSEPTRPCRLLSSSAPKYELVEWGYLKGPINKLEHT